MVELAAVLWSLSALIHDAGEDTAKEFSWMPPLCPNCHSPLSGKFANTLLLCLKCDREFELQEVEYAGGR